MNGRLPRNRAKKIRRYLRFVSLKYKYYSWPRIILGALYAIGIHIQPFYVVREGITALLAPPPPPEFPEMSIRYLEEEDMRTIALLPDYAISETALRARILEGKCCLGVFSRGHLTAFSWCDLDACHFPGYPFALSPTEAYLYDAHTVSAFRGKGLAPFVRHQMYRALEERGRFTFYSITERFNEPALRFKKKLHGRVIDRGLHIGVFKMWHFNTSAASAKCLGRLRVKR